MLIGMDTIVSKLRIEIQEGKKMRHEFVLKKFSFLTLLLGGGALPDLVFDNVLIDLTWLLLLVPIVAIAFDFYILAEDYRIKRAGQFLRAEAIGVDEDERRWESFAKEHPNHLSTMSFVVVTMIYFSGAAIILYQSNFQKIESFFLWWIVIVLIAEIFLVLISVFLRWWLVERPEYGGFCKRL